MQSLKDDGNYALKAGDVSDSEDSLHADKI